MGRIEQINKTCPYVGHTMWQDEKAPNQGWGRQGEREERNEREEKKVTINDTYKWNWGSSIETMMNYWKLNEVVLLLMNSPHMVNHCEITTKAIEKTVIGDRGRKGLWFESADIKDTESRSPLGCSRDTHCVCLGLLTRGSSPCHNWLHDRHPALFVWETGSHEVNGLSRPAGSVTMGLQLQDIRNIWHVEKEVMTSIFFSHFNDFK